MGTICILFGVIALFASTGVGFYLSSYVLASETYVNLLEISKPINGYLIIVGACVFIGLLIFMGLVTSGLTYNRVKKLSRDRSRKYRDD